MISRGFSHYVEPEPNSGCHLWTGALDSKGYGMFWVGSASQPRQKAHRVAFLAAGGVIPAGMQIDHKCRVRCCVNPAHLEAVTCRENIVRGHRARKQETTL